MKNNKSFIFAIILVTITFTLLNIIKIVSRPKVVYIGKHCFSYCENPEKVYMPKSI